MNIKDIERDARDSNKYPECKVCPKKCIHALRNLGLDCFNIRSCDIFRQIESDRTKLIK